MIFTNLHADAWKKVSETKEKGFFEGEISDETGNCHFVRWLGTYKDSFKRGSIIMLIGKKNEYGGKIQINIPSKAEIEGLNLKYPSKWKKIGVNKPFKLLAI